MKKLKKLLLGICVGVLTCVLCAVCAGAEVSGNYEYSVNTDGTVTITDYTGSEKNVVIPNKLGGKTVTVIGTEAFYNNLDIVSVKIPDTVIRVDYNSFKGCSNMTSVALSKNLKRIGDYAFYGCDSLTSVAATDSLLSVGMYAFSECSKLETVIFSYGLEFIGKYAFYKCSVLQNINIPASVTTIGTSAFSYCQKLESITIPEGVTVINSNTFYYCTSLKSVSLPSTIDNIGSYAFYRCSSLESIDIPYGITAIAYSTFSYCRNIKSLNIPSSVTAIDSNAFEECDSLVSITVPSSVRTIESGAFGWCNKLETVNIGSGVEYIGSTAFAYSYSLKAINVNASNEYFSSVSGVMYNKDKTELLHYPPAKAGTSFTIPSTVKTVGSYAFYDCSYLINLTIPSSVTVIGDSAFNSMYNLASLKIPSSVTEIGKYAFAHSASIEAVTIPGTVKVMDEGIFQGCDGLVTVTIASGVTEIGNYAFNDCDNLQSISIPATVTTIGNGAFACCSSLSSIKLDSNNKQYTVVNNVLFDKSKSVLIKYASAKAETKYTVPSTVKYINDYAFDNANNLVTVDLPEGLKVIREYAFYSSDNLEKIVIPDSVTDIEQDAFEYCYSLTSVKFGKNLSNIDSYAFYKCGFTSVIIPPNVNSIKSNSFRNSDSSRKIEVKGYAGTYAERYANTNAGSVTFTPIAELTQRPVINAIAGDRQVALSWNAVPGAEYYQVIRYKDGAFSSVVFVTEPKVVIKGLTNNYKYTYIVKAYDGINSSTVSKAVSVTPDALASPVLSVVPGNKQVTLQWNAVAGASYYQVIRYNNGVYTKVADVSGTTVTVKGLTNDFEYTYLVKAVSANGLTAFSNAVKVKPTAVLGKAVLKATAGNKVANLSWTAVAGATKYQIIRYSNGVYTEVATIGGTSVTVQGLTNGYEYTYLIKAIAADGRTSFSNAVNVTPKA